MDKLTTNSQTILINEILLYRVIYYTGKGRFLKMKCFEIILDSHAITPITSSPTGQILQSCQWMGTGTPGY